MLPPVTLAVGGASKKVSGASQKHMRTPMPSHSIRNGCAENGQSENFADTGDRFQPFEAVVVMAAGGQGLFGVHRYPSGLGEDGVERHRHRRIPLPVAGFASRRRAEDHRQERLSIFSQAVPPSDRFCLDHQTDRCSRSASRTASRRSGICTVTTPSKRGRFGPPRFWSTRVGSAQSIPTRHHHRPLLRSALPHPPRPWPGPPRGRHADAPPVAPSPAGASPTGRHPSAMAFPSFKKDNKCRSKW